MICFALFFLYIFGAMLVAEIIVTGIHHVGLWIEEKQDRKKEITRQQKYSAMFEYMKNN